MAEPPSPQQALWEALGAAGAAIEAIPHTERREIVRDFLRKKGLLPDNPMAEDFLVGVFLETHWRRITTEQAMEAAWDEGYEACERDRRSPLTTPVTPNPYAEEKNP